MDSNTTNSNNSHRSSGSSRANHSFIFNASSNSNDPSTSSDSSNPNDPSNNNDPSSVNDSSGSSSSPNNNIDRSSSINPPNPATSSNPVQSADYNDARCRFCNHNRLHCPVCRPRRTSHRANNRCRKKRQIKARGKAYCCKCSHGKKLTRHFDPANKEKLALIKYATLKDISAAELRAYTTNSLKDKQCYSPTQLCGQLPPIHMIKDQGVPRALIPPITVMRCHIPSTKNHTHSRQALYNLDCTVQQVSNTVRRLICPLSSGRPIDAGILNASLNALFNQLAFLNHRAFPALTPAIHPNKKSFQDALRTVRGKVQTAYKALLAAARRAGVLERSRSRVVRAARVSETTRAVPGLIARPFLGLRMELVEVNREVAAQRILRRARELARELHSWIALLGAGRSL
jgi:hypothetical protein